jgi:uncharacterized membrane protein
MLNRLRDSGRLPLTVFLVVLSAYCGALSAFRSLLIHTHSYLFLNWNLFLAFLPWLLSSLAVLRTVKNRIALLVIMAVWLALFPNCPYILTDLMHLRQFEDAPLWLDLVLVLSFAWAGLCYGFMSLMDIRHLLRERFHAGRKTIEGLTVCVIYLAAVGVYIGRFWRWNSWDLLGNPAELMRDTLDRITDGVNYIRVFGFTILTGTLLNAMFFFVRRVRRTSEGEGRHADPD